MRKLLTVIIDTLFPPSADARIVRTLSLSLIKSVYQESTHTGVVSLSSFKDSRVRALIHTAKYEGDRDAQRYLAELVRIYRENHRIRTETLWIPIPLSRARARARGYNQVTEILSHVQNIQTIANDVFVRIRDTRPQVELTRSERLTNMKEAFQVRQPEAILGKHIILVDDVTTTGATLREAETAILACGPASVTLLALAH